MAVTPADILSLPIHYLRETIAASANFRTWVSAADVAGARLRIHYNQVIVAMAKATITSGAIASIAVPEGGTGYTAAPDVAVKGDGSGGRATAAVSGGSVSSITVTNGGSDYTDENTEIVVDLPTHPFAVIMWADNWARVMEAAGDRNHFIQEGDLLLVLRASVSESHDEADALFTFTNSVGAIIEDMEALAGTAGYLNITGMSFEEQPQRPLEDEIDTLSDFYRTVLRIQFSS